MIWSDKYAHTSVMQVSKATKPEVSDQKAIVLQLRATVPKTIAIDSSTYCFDVYPRKLIQLYISPMPEIVIPKIE